MGQQPSRVCDEAVIDSDQIVAAGANRLSLIDSLVEVIPEQPVLPEADPLEGEAEEEQQQGEDGCYHDTANQNFPSVLHPV